MLVAAAVFFILSSVLSVHSIYKVYSLGKTELFTWDNTLAQACAGGIVMGMLLAVGSIILWQPEFSDAAPTGVKIYIGAITTYLLSWTLFAWIGCPLPSPHTSGLSTAKFTYFTASVSEDASNRHLHVFFRMTVPIVLWCASQVTALIALLLIGSKTLGVDGLYTFLLVAQTFITVYTLIPDGYLYLNALMQRESDSTLKKYIKMCLVVLHSIVIAVIVGYLATRQNDNGTAAPNCTETLWQCPSNQPSSANAKWAKTIFEQNYTYTTAATLSHILNFGMPALYFVWLATYKNWVVLCNYAACIVVALYAAYIAKHNSQRTRPAVFYNLINVTELKDKSYRDQYDSFFSADASISMAGSAFMVMFLLNKKSSIYTWLATTIVLLASVTGCVLRTVAMMHYLSDISVGAGVGLLSALLYGGSVFSNDFAALQG